MKPLEGEEWKLSPSLILTLNTRFPAEVDDSDLVWWFFCVLLGFFSVSLWKGWPSAEMGPSHWMCALSKFWKWMMSNRAEREVLYRHSSNAVTYLWGIFFQRELGCMFCWAWIIVTCLVGRQWTFDYKGGIWNAGEEYHVYWVSSHGF